MTNDNIFEYEIKLPKLLGPLFSQKGSCSLFCYPNMNSNKSLTVGVLSHAMSVCVTMCVRSCLCALWSRSHIQSSCSHVGAADGFYLLHSAELWFGQQLRKNDTHRRKNTACLCRNGFIGVYWYLPTKCQL